MSGMARPVNAATKRVLDTLVAALDADGEAKIHNAGETFMPVYVLQVGPSHFLVAHYFEQNGDRMPDPEVVFWRTETGAWFPASIVHSTGHAREAIRFDDNGRPTHIAPRAQSDLVSFTTVWMRNIKRQQALKLV